MLPPNLKVFLSCDLAMHVNPCFLTGLLIVSKPPHIPQALRVQGFWFCGMLVLIIRVRVWARHTGYQIGNMIHVKGVAPDLLSYFPVRVSSRRLSGPMEGCLSLWILLCSFFLYTPPTTVYCLVVSGFHV